MLGLSAGADCENRARAGPRNSEEGGGQVGGVEYQDFWHFLTAVCYGRQQMTRLKVLHWKRTTRKRRGIRFHSKKGDHVHFSENEPRIQHITALHKEETRKDDDEASILILIFWNEIPFVFFQGYETFGRVGLLAKFGTVWKCALYMDGKSCMNGGL